MDTLLIITFVSFIKLRYNMKFDTFGDKFESWMTVGTMAAYILVPTIGIVQVLRNFDKINPSDQKEKTK